MACSGWMASIARLAGRAAGIGTRAMVLAVATVVATATLLPAASAAIPSGIVVIVADDLSEHDLQFMPQTSAFMASRGMRFENSIVSNALCCPSRATLLTGRYSQNTGVYANDGPNGGFDAFFAAGMEARTVATWLKAAGWTTGLVGKYLNGYEDSRLARPTHIAPGWDHWVALASELRYYGYTLNENGRLVKYGEQESDYITDVLLRHTRAVLTSMLQTPQRPFFLTLTPIAPHLWGHSNAANGYDPSDMTARRHANLFLGLRAPRSAAFNRCDTVNGVRQQLCGTAALTAADIEWIDQRFRQRAMSLQALDETFVALTAQLAAAGVLDTTYIVFTSDNGINFGERFFQTGKGNLYESASRVPLWISGPAVSGGRRSMQMAVNVDLAPTLAGLAGIPVPTDIDGRSLVPLLGPPATPAPPWRKVMLKVSGTRETIDRGRGLRSLRYAYYERLDPATGVRTRELYDLQSDPHETRNLSSRLTRPSAAALSAALARLASCAGPQCRLLEDEWNDNQVRLAAQPAQSP